MKSFATGAEKDAISRFERSVSIAAVLTFAVMTLGALVRAKDAGLSCPDWPLCYGRVIPTFDWQIFFEWVHRLFAGSLGILLLLLVAQVARSRPLRREFGRPLLLASLLMVVQISLGALTVLRLLDPKTVAGHLVNGTLFFGLLVFTACRARILVAPPRPDASPRWRWSIFAAMMLVFGQIFLGGLVSAHYAGRACADFPTCNGELWPRDGSFVVYIHMIHRIVAVAVVLALAVLLGVARGTSAPASLQRHLTALFWLSALQFILGVANVTLGLPDGVTVAHLANAILMFGILVSASVQAFAGATNRPVRDVIPSAERVGDLPVAAARAAQHGSLTFPANRGVTT